VPKHIVIIEHDQDTLDIISGLLESEGHIVTGYILSPPIAEITFMRADCIIVEDWLPTVSGHAICLMLKAKVQTSAIPVVLVSNTNLFEPTANLCQADAIVGKPFISRELVQVVSYLLSRSRMPVVNPGQL
jgi:DNA-binding response OmpR family regulator